MAGTPDVLTSTPASPRRRWLTLALVLVVAGAAGIVALIGGGADGPDPAAGPALPSAAGPTATAVTPTSRPRPTRTTIDPADRITGSLPASVRTPSGALAVEAAHSVADTYCDRISTWRLTIDGESGEYFRVIVLMRPNGPAYRNVALHFELEWVTDHYDWAGSRVALETCP